MNTGLTEPLRLCTFVRAEERCATRRRRPNRAQSRDTNLPLGFPRAQTPQGQFYCSVGAKNTFGREVIETHLDQCLDAGLNVEGINAEVAVGQWEYQIFSKGAKNAGDEIWVSRYLAERNAEKYGLALEWHPNPLGATDWNGSGMHANFSNGPMRDAGDEQLFTKICTNFTATSHRISSDDFALVSIF